MEPLAKKYQDRLDEVKEALQNSELLEAFLEDEEEEQYQAMRDEFEPPMADLYHEVAIEAPLQLFALEKAMLDPELEGMYLPKVLGFSILRGELDDTYKYIHPQHHFKEVLLAICNSSNFEYLKKRTGLSVQVGFALSSDIWITNLINEITNKRVRYFLQSQKLPKYRFSKERRIAFKRYYLQFRSDNFHSAIFPENLNELKVQFPALYRFLKWRVRHLPDHNQSLVKKMGEFLSNEDFEGTPEYIRMLGLYTCFFDLTDAQSKQVLDISTTLRKEESDYFQKNWWHFLQETFDGKLKLDAKVDRRAIERLDLTLKDEISKFYQLADEIHTKGIVHEEVIESVRHFYNHHAGLSDINACLRNIFLGYFGRLIPNLEPEEYHEWFELFKIIPLYMDIFSNEEFNQELKALSMDYIKRLMKTYTDKRGKDYQDIKKFVTTTFEELGFLNAKQIKELFKTRRKRKKTA